ncbi:endoglin isoform X2 [Hemicordylus capensis]|uniref:endoglin isoform X2 n=1 Tax=Hemicordylus capensis TaxID=884348 RepID=UPI002303F2EA|nr:endoglin isoform X2 [Hemicordylus capensis]
METVRRLAVLLALGAVVSANPVNVQECTLKPVEKNEGVTVVYTTSRVTSGCISRGPIDPNLEVHVLSLKFSDPPKMLELPFSVSAAKGNSQRTVFVVSSNAPYILLKVSVTDHPLTFIHPRRVYVQGSNSNATVLPESDEELLKWVDEKYGGVSSFAVLDKPSRVHFKVGREPSATPDCIPQPDFDAEQYLETETTSHETESCLGSSGNTGNESHILWLKEALGQAVDLNMKMTCDRGELPQGLPVLLVLKGPRGVLWKIDELPPYTKFLTSGNYSIKTFGLWPVEGTNLSDTKEGLMKEAYLNGFPSIASFTEIPSAKSIILELVRCAEARATTSPRVISPSESSLNEKFQQLLRTFPSWRCMDDAIEVALPRSYLLALKGSISEITLEDPSCRAKENATHFVLSSKLGDCKTQVEENIRAKNQLVLTVASVPDKITVPFQCDLPEKLSLHLCPALDCSLPLSTITVVVNQVTYVQVSFRTTNKESSVQLRDCFLRTPGTASPQPLIHEGTPQGSVQILSSSSMKIDFSFIYKVEEGRWSPPSTTLLCQALLIRPGQEPHRLEASLDVKLENPNPPPNRGLGISTVLGITFGAFFIGVLLTAALWYIYSHTRPMAKMQPVSTNLPPSESSSTNHSIGSTQSTPCSTSSMA